MARQSACANCEGRDRQSMSGPQAHLTLDANYGTARLVGRIHTISGCRRLVVLSWARMLSSPLPSAWKRSNHGGLHRGVR